MYEFCYLKTDTFWLGTFIYCILVYHQRSKNIARPSSSKSSILVQIIPFCMNFSLGKTQRKLRNSVRIVSVSLTWHIKYVYFMLASSLFLTFPSFSVRGSFVCWINYNNTLWTRAFFSGDKPTTSSSQFWAEFGPRFFVAGWFRGKITGKHCALCFGKNWGMQLLLKCM